MLALTQAHALLIAERSRDIGVITEAVTDVLATNPYANLRDVEMVFRDGAAQATWSPLVPSFVSCSACRHGLQSPRLA